MTETSSHGSGGSDQNSLLKKQPERDIGILLSGRLVRFPSASLYQKPWEFIINFFKYWIITSLKLSLISFPIFTLMILISYSAHYTVPITEVAATASDVILHLFVVEIFFIFTCWFFLLLPFFVLGSFNQAVRNAYLPNRPRPETNLRNLVIMVAEPTLSFGGLLLIFIHIIILWYVKEDPILHDYTWVYECALLLYSAFFLLAAWASVGICRRGNKRREKAIELLRKRKQRSNCKESNFEEPNFKEHRRFKFVDSITSFLWILAFYAIWGFLAAKDIDNFLVFSAFSPLLISISYNVISKALKNVWHFFGFSLIIILAVVVIWPGAAELSRIAFHRLGIGGEIPVQVALLPENKLGLIEEVIEQNEVSGSIYRETIGPFRLILYGKEKIYFSTMTNQGCLPEHVGAAPDNTLCERVFSIRTEYIASIDTTKRISVGFHNTH